MNHFVGSYWYHLIALTVVHRELETRVRCRAYDKHDVTRTWWWKLWYPLTDGSKGSDHVVLGRMLVIKGSLPEPMSEGIDAESRLSKIRQLAKDKSRLKTDVMHKDQS